MTCRIPPLFGLLAITFLQWVSFSSTYVTMPVMMLNDQCAKLGLSGEDCDKSDQAQSGQAIYFLYWMLAAEIPSVVFCTLVSHLSDVIGRKPILILASLRSVLLYGVITQFGAGILSLVVVSILNGFGDIYVVNGVACASGVDLTVGLSEAERASLLGRLEAALWSGQVLGPLIGGQLSTIIGNQPSFWFPVALCVVSSVIAFLLPETLQSDRRVPFSWRKAHPFAVLPILAKHPRSIILAIGLLFAQLGINTGVSTWPMFCKHLLGVSNAVIGAAEASFFAANAFGLFILLPLFIRVLSPRSIILLACACSILMWGLHFALRAVWQLFFTVCLGALAALLFPTVRAGIATDFGPQMYGGALGTVALVQDLIMVAQGPAANSVWNWVHVSHLPDGLAYLVTASYYVVASFIFLCLPYRSKAQHQNTGSGPDEALASSQES